MIRIGICDDDGRILESLKRTVEQQYEDHAIVTGWKSPQDMLEQFEDTSYCSLDIVLIDIVLQEQNGIELAQEIQKRSRRTKIIFITGYIEFAPDIFRVEPIYLLKKPISIEKLKEAIDRAIEKLQEEEQQEVVLQNKGTVLRININYVSYVENQRRKQLIYKNDNTISVYMKMDELEAKLGKTFVRCHHSYLVNMEYIKNFTSQTIELIDGTIIPVSRPKSKQAKKQFLLYLGEKI